MLSLTRHFLPYPSTPPWLRSHKADSWVSRESDVVATRERPPGHPLPPGTNESFHLTKRHARHAAALEQREQLVQARSQLAGLWTELLLLRLGGAPSQRGA